jgi:uncharacterized protein (UPF0297 family)
MESKSNKFGANEIFQFSILIGAIILGYYMYTTRNIMAVKRLPKNLPQNLQDLYDQLKEKGYKPTTSPKQFSGYFISFEIGEGDEKIIILINDKNIITITTQDKNKPPYVITYSEGRFISRDGLIDESDDLLSGLLQIIENEDYK